MRNSKTVFFKQQGGTPLWKTVIGGLTAGLAVGAVLQMLGVPEPVIIGFSAGVTAAIVFTFGRNAGK